MSGKSISIPVFLRVLQQSVLELLGEAHSRQVFERPELAMIVDAAAPGAGITAILEELGRSFAERYDKLTAQGLLIRTGRASLVFLRRLEPRISALGTIENRLKPVDSRFRDSLSEIATIFSNPADLKIDVQPAGSFMFSWRMRAATQTEVAMFFTPYFFFGLLQEFCEWLDARKDYQLAYASDNGATTDKSIHLEIHNPD